jgi:creatinine amidohydrolase/Fe(II)-dependent formamide hydrolase-like protein
MLRKVNPHARTPMPASFLHTRAFRVGLVAAGVVVGALSVVSRPLTAPAAATVEIADMTWIEVRDAIRRGAETVIVPSGGIEANGSHMIIGKHQHIVQRAARMLAEDHGRALVAPVIAHVPQGAFEPPTGNMQLPGTIGVTEEVFEGILEGSARSLKAAGFKRIVFMADHGGSIAPQGRVAARLQAEWRAAGVSVIALDAYYAEGDKAQRAYLTARGETDRTIGDHAGLQDTAELMAAHPAGVMLARLSRALPSLESDGSSGAPERATAEMGRDLIQLKVKAGLAQLRAAGF